MNKNKIKMNKNKKGEVSNNLLAILLIVAILIGLIGLLVPKRVVVGKVTDLGQLQVTVGAVTAINFTDDIIDWGTGTVTEGYSSCTLDTEGTVGPGCTGFTAQTNGFTIENIGNQDVILQLATGKTAATLLGGTNPVYQYKMSVNERDACIGMTPTTWTDVNATSPGTTVCTNLQAADANDAVDVDVRIVIPSDSYTGTLSDTFTATATAIAE
jgi:cytoskeletal protein RodZ